MNKALSLTGGSTSTNDAIRKLSKEAQHLIEKFGYLPSTKAKVSSDRNDSS